MEMTLREVALAWQGKCDFEWTQTAEIMAAVYNIRQRGRNDTRTFRGSDFYAASDSKQAERARSTEGTRLTIGLLRALKGSFTRKDATPCKSR